MTESLHNFAAGLHEQLLDGQLDAEGRRWLARHRESCPACERAFARLERITAALEALEPLEPSRAFADRVLAEIRPAPLPRWARWRLASGWQRAAASIAVAVLALVGFAVPLGGLLLAGDAGNVALLFRWPELAADALVSVVRAADPFRPVLDLAALLATVTRTLLLTPQGSAAAAAGALLSAAAFRQLSNVLAAPAAPPRA